MKWFSRWILPMPSLPVTSETGDPESAASGTEATPTEEKPAEGRCLGCGGAGFHTFFLASLEEIQSLTLLPITPVAEWTFRLCAECVGRWGSPSGHCLQPFTDLTARICYDCRRVDDRDPMLRSNRMHEHPLMARIRMTIKSRTVPVPVRIGTIFLCENCEGEHRVMTLEEALVSVGPADPPTEEERAEELQRRTRTLFSRN